MNNRCGVCDDEFGDNSEAEDREICRAGCQTQIHSNCFEEQEVCLDCRSLSNIFELREATGCGLFDCKLALEKEHWNGYQSKQMVVFS